MGVDFEKDLRFVKYKKSLRMKFKKMFSNRFSFLNCEKMTLEKQKLLFNTLYEFGNVAVKKINDEYYIFTATSILYDLDGMANEAVLIPAAYYFGKFNSKDDFLNSFNSNIKYNFKDTVILQSDYFFETDRENVEIYIYELARLYLIYEKIATQQRNLLLIFESSGEDTKIKKAVEDIRESVVILNETFNQKNEDAKIKEIINKRSESYIDKIDLSGNLNNAINMINAYWDFTLKNLGLPKTPFWKKERLLNAEMEALNADFSLETKNDERDLQIFVNLFNKKFNEKMELNINSVENVNEGSLKNDSDNKQ